MSKYDVAIIGSGPGGYVAAIRCAQLGKKVAIIEKENLGGVCLNWGCIPTKALLRSAEVKSIIDHAEDFGLKVSGKCTVDFKKVIARSRRVAEQLSGGIGHLMKKNKITVINGYGKFITKNKIEVTNGSKKETIDADSIIISTGATARALPGADMSHKRIWTAREAMLPDFEPKSLLIIGAGAIGIEFASFYRTLGVEVTVLEMQKNILPQEDVEISNLSRKQFEKVGINILTESKLSKIKPGDKFVEVVITDKSGKEISLKFDAAIVAIGVVGNTDKLGLEKTKVKAERNQIKTDSFCQTDEKGIYAIGDVAGAPWLAHKASHEGVIAAQHIAGVKDNHALKRDCIPGCTYSMPQIASIGLTEEQVKEQKLNVKIGRFPFIGNGKAVSHGKIDGLIKTIFDKKTGEILGVHMVGPDVTEMISTFCVAKSAELTERDIIGTIFPHPTLSEMIHESTLDAEGQVIHF